MRSLWHRFCQLVFGKDLIDRQSFTVRRKCDNFLFLLLAAMIGVSWWFMWPLMTIGFYVFLMITLFWFTVE